MGTPAASSMAVPSDSARTITRQDICHHFYSNLIGRQSQINDPNRKVGATSDRHQVDCPISLSSSLSPQTDVLLHMKLKHYSLSLDFISLSATFLTVDMIDSWQS